jgi:hypothetical protein
MQLERGSDEQVSCSLGQEPMKERRTQELSSWRERPLPSSPPSSTHTKAQDVS